MIFVAYKKKMNAIKNKLIIKKTLKYNCCEVFVSNLQVNDVVLFF